MRQKIICGGANALDKSKALPSLISADISMVSKEHFDLILDYVRSLI